MNDFLKYNNNTIKKISTFKNGVVASYIIIVITIIILKNYEYMPLSIIVILLNILLIILFKIEIDRTVFIWMLVSPMIQLHDFFEYGSIPNPQYDRLYILILFLYLFIIKNEIDIFKSSYSINSLDKALLVYVIFIFISILFSFMYKGPIRFAIDSIIVPILLYIIAKRLVKNQVILKELFPIVLILLLVLSGIGCLERLTERDILKVLDSRSFEELGDLFRVNGPFRMAEEYGIVIIILILYIYTMRDIFLDIQRRWITVSSMYLGATAIVYTLTRGVWLSFIGGILYVIGKKSKGKLFLYIILISILYLSYSIFLPFINQDIAKDRISNKGTIYARIATYKSALNMFLDHPLIGVGYGCYTETYERYPIRYEKYYNGVVSVRTPHNNFLGILAETGIIGLFCYISLFIIILRYCNYLQKNNNDSLLYQYGIFMSSATWSYLIAGIGLDVTHQSGYINKLYFLFVGLLSGLYNNSSNSDNIVN
jgi:hypothetical protein